MVRVNASGTPWHAGDLAAVAARRPAAMIVPKVEGALELDGAAATLAPDVPIIAVVETAAEIPGARAIAAHPALRRLAFGSVDFCADLGCQHTREALLAARSELVLASRLAGILAPLDGVATAIDDASAANDDARYGRCLGFGGKLAIHPRQIVPIRRKSHGPSACSPRATAPRSSMAP